MQWLNDPPCGKMKLELSDPVAGRLELSGPATSERISGGVMAAFGATFSSMALPLLRAPIPAPFKLIPLAFGVVGGGVSAYGMANAIGQASVLFERSKGVRFRWKLGPMDARELFIPASDIADFEVSVTRHERHRDSPGFGSTSLSYQLHLVTKAGQAVPFESFSLRSQAALRHGQITEVMRLGEPEVKRKRRGASKKR